MSILVTPPSGKNEVTDAFDFAKDILKFPEDHPRNLEFYIEVFIENPNYILIAKINNRIVGVVLASNQSEDSLLVGELAVSEEFRGKGIGNLLMTKIEETARKMKKKQISLGAVEKAEVFYIKIGYKPKLFVQITGDNRLNEIKQCVEGLKVDWENTGDGYSKVIFDTNGINKDLQKLFNEKINAHTQYLFSKDL